jgi:predicted ATP-dependent endonuclease of OLD family
MVSKKVARKKVDHFEVVPKKIYVKNFGPVAEANIELKPLTVLMGPNNTGKTYISTLLLLADNVTDLLHYYYHVILPDIQKSKKVVRVIMGEKEIEISGDKVDVSDFIKQSLDKILAGLYSVNNLGELVKKGAEEAEISIQFEQQLKDGGITYFDVNITITKEGNLLLKSLVPAFVPLMRQVVYVPAERAGMMRTYKQLLRLFLEDFRRFRLPPPLEVRAKKIMGEESISRIRLPGVVSILLDEILSINRFTIKERAESKYRGALELLEDETLQGVIELGEDLAVTYTEKRSGQSFDLINTSSMVSEVSGIYILTKLLRPNSWFVIEEPEAHVHPKGQMGIARFLAALAKSGVNVFITTHSDLIALKLANMVGLAKLKEDDRVKLGYKPDEYLEREKLALYFMDPEDLTAKRIEVSETGEIEELPTYSKVVEEMYGEAVKLLKLHGKIPTLSYTE